MIKTTKPLFNDVEYTYLFNGYFDLTDSSYDLESKLVKHTKKKIKVTLVPSNSGAERSIQFSNEDDKYFVNFGKGFVAISFVSNGPGDKVNISTIQKIAAEMLSFLGKEYKLTFNRVSVSKEVIVTGLTEVMVNSGSQGFFVSEYLNKDINDWDLSFNRNYDNHVNLLIGEDLIEHYQVYSSTLLRSAERVICYRVRLQTKNNRRPIFTIEKALDFVKNGAAAFNHTASKFEKGWLQFVTDKITSVKAKKVNNGK